MALSYSFHISNKKNAINTKQNLKTALKHNLRAYKSENNDKGINITLIGSKSPSRAYMDFIELYKNEFEDSIKEYNSTKNKTRDKIQDYFEKVSNDKKTELATEIIIQVGDMEFWQNKNIEEKSKMTEIFKNQLEKLQNELPNFKIVNATVHYDENSPHIQILGVPIAEYSKGLSKRVSKTKIFTKESLERLQENMRNGIEEKMKELYGNDISLKSKEKGRNNDLLIKDYIRVKQEQKERIESELKPIEFKLKNNIKELEDKIEKTNDELNSSKTRLNSFYSSSEYISYDNIQKIKKNAKNSKKMGIFENKNEIVLKTEDYLNLLNTATYNSKNLEKREKEIEKIIDNTRKILNKNKELEQKIEDTEKELQEKFIENQELKAQNNYYFELLDKVFDNKVFNEIIKIVVRIKNNWDVKDSVNKTLANAFNFKNKDNELER